MPGIAKRCAPLAERAAGLGRGDAATVIDFAVGEGPQEKLLGLQAYDPVPGSAEPKADATARRFLVMASENIRDMVILDEQESFKYMAANEERWNKLLVDPAKRRPAPASGRAGLPEPGSMAL